jgi:ABC-type dipeptide/oligopeptide/nickel transport system permease subunit
MADAAPLALPARRRRRNVRLLIGGVLVAACAVVAALGPRIAPYDPNAQDLMATLDPPSAAHWLGADQIGRDVLSRLIVGARYTLSITLVSVSCATVIGVMLGAVAAYVGGVVDRVLTGFVELLLTIPNLVLAIAIAAAVGASAEGLTVAIIASFVPSIAVLVRARVLELREEVFVSAAVAVGMRPSRVLLRHILPNAVGIIIIESSLLAGQAVLVAAALGFLGLGVQPPAAEWGAMLGDSREVMEVAPHLVIAPGVAISLLVFAFNLLGDGLRDRFDPRLVHR